MTAREERAAPEARLTLPARRLLWCSAGGRVLHGHTLPAPPREPGLLESLLGLRPHGGTLFEFEAVELEPALRALDAHLASPGAFALETSAGARLDFLAARALATVTIDCWFLDADDELDAVPLSRPAARELLASVYELERDADVVARLRALAQGSAAA